MNKKRREYHSVKHAANKQRTTQKALSGIIAKPRDSQKISRMTFDALTDMYFEH